ncbi:hypothetical protein NJB1907f44_32760 [Mycobacterium marinum]|nr:hypothetical protein KST_03393 [Mycobacterium marinum]GJO05000.1 hypothetical protein NJB1907f34b_27370 [Mycobacterium marinum]GJO06489.1 hypothetical protein NJB1808e29_35740 [Mycobacterium marinum]GJO14583.1 hypothetical protein NJB1907E90_39980 [Mycobacterium marinum]GJO29625.1 hypothetical protein NJB1907E11_49650 [Mycobacterium marinum]
MKGSLIAPSRALTATLRTVPLGQYRTLAEIMVANAVSARLASDITHIDLNHGGSLSGASLGGTEL